MTPPTTKSPQPPISHIVEVYHPVLHASPPTTPATTPSSFHLFPDLPAELRAMIWTAALLNETTFNKSGNSMCYRNQRAIDIHMKHDDILIQTQRSYPTLFFVSREARAEAARVDSGKWYPVGVKGASVYTSHGKDMIWVHDCCTDLDDSFKTHVHTAAEIESGPGIDVLKIMWRVSVPLTKSNIVRVFDEQLSDFVIVDAGRGRKRFYV